MTGLGVVEHRHHLHRFGMEQDSEEIEPVDPDVVHRSQTGHRRVGPPVVVVAAAQRPPAVGPALTSPMIPSAMSRLVLNPGGDGGCGS